MLEHKFWEGFTVHFDPSALQSIAFTQFERDLLTLASQRDVNHHRPIQTQGAFQPAVQPPDQAGAHRWSPGVHLIDLEFFECALQVGLSLQGVSHREEQG
jgi:hypothetical protein